ncbi:MAG: hypothetical protein JXR14_09640 [Paracoccaceae bacterium]
MEKILSALARKCHDALAADSGPGGRAKVAEILSDLLAEPANIEALIPPGTGERDILYQDPDLGFCILAHHYKGPKSSPPHDHGPSWAIYAQARGETEMTDFELVTPAREDAPGQVRATRSYHLRPGDAYVYEVGDLHAPTRTGPTSLLRIEGTDMSKVKRLSYEAV